MASTQLTIHFIEVGVYAPLLHGWLIRSQMNRIRIKENTISAIKNSEVEIFHPIWLKRERERKREKKNNSNAVTKEKTNEEMGNDRKNESGRGRDGENKWKRDQAAVLVLRYTRFLRLCIKIGKPSGRKRST